MSDEDQNLEQTFNEAIEGFADMYDEIDADEESGSNQLHLSSQPRDKYTIVGNIDEGGMKKIFICEKLYCENIFSFIGIYM